MAGRSAQLNKRGQSTLEYVLILTAIIAAIILIANTVMRRSVENSLTHAGDEMEGQVNRITFGAGMTTY